MSTRHHTLVVVSADPGRRFDLDRAAELSGMHPEMILEFVRAEVVRAAGRDQRGGPSFDESEIVRLRQIEHLRQREQVSLRTICQIVRLLDRLEAAELELRLLRERLR